MTERNASLLAFGIGVSVRDVAYKTQGVLDVEWWECFNMLAVCLLWIWGLHAFKRELGHG